MATFLSYQLFWGILEAAKPYPTVYQILAVVCQLHVHYYYNHFNIWLMKKYFIILI